ncbi:hypothetical protein X943_000240 [Babesia divergens]|uniref:Uncharacterized protein n=1 Tax=Babesia divergens TaxID=32595 RepID=A0AAD9GJA1_BABDI|nr:hypothetical protein X943_000240 [Babesia divergens]
MAYKPLNMLSRECLLGYAVIGGFIYTNGGEWQHLCRHYFNMLVVKNDQGVSRSREFRERCKKYRVEKPGLGDRAMHYPNTNEAFNSLRTGDLIFLRYDIEKLPWAMRCKLSAIRRLSRNKYYDDLGMAYNHHNKTYEKNCYGIVVMDGQQLIKSFLPEVITVKRLVCDESRRKHLETAIKLVCDQPKLSTRSNIANILQGWREYLSPDGNKLFTYIQCSQLLKDSQPRFKPSTYTGAQLNNEIIEVGYSRKHDQGKGEDRGDNINQRKLIGDIYGINTKYDDVMQMRRVCTSVVNKFDEHSHAIMPMNLNVYGTTSLVACVYTQAGIVSGKCKLDSLDIHHLLKVDCLPSNARQDVVSSRLSDPFHIYNGSIYRTMFENMKELSDVNLLWNNL